MFATSYSFPLLDIFLTMLIIAGLFLWVVLVVMVLSDLFHRDFGGGKKALWAVVVLILPLVGALIYLAVEGRGMSGRGLKRQVARGEQYGGISKPATRLRDPEGLTELIMQRDAGSITQEQYEAARSELFERNR